jgi:hypothetical protein
MICSWPDGFFAESVGAVDEEKLLFKPFPCPIQKFIHTLNPATHPLGGHIP